MGQCVIKLRRASWIKDSCRCVEGYKVWTGHPTPNIDQLRTEDQYEAPSASTSQRWTCDVGVELHRCQLTSTFFLQGHATPCERHFMRLPAGAYVAEASLAEASLAEAQLDKFSLASRLLLFREPRIVELPSTANTISGRGVSAQVTIEPISAVHHTVQSTDPAAFWYPSRSSTSLSSWLHRLPFFVFVDYPCGGLSHLACRFLSLEVGRCPTLHQLSLLEL